MLKKAMIMSAGMGTRLEPLTLSVPKPLIPLANIPIMDYILYNLSENGIKDVIANLYYLSDQIIERYHNKQLYGINFNYIKEETLSGTAGGVKKCQSFFEGDEDFLVLSGDGLTDFEVMEAYSSHKRSGAIATMIVNEIDKTEVSKYGVVVTDENGFVKEFQEKPKEEEALSNLINTGIYIFKTEIFNIIPPDTFFDFAKDVFPRVMRYGEKINTFQTRHYWSDIGSLNQYMMSNIDVLNNKLTTAVKLIGNTSEIGYISDSPLNTDTTVTGHCSIGKNCTFGRNVEIINSIIWDNVKLEDNITIENSIIGSNNTIDKTVKNQVIGSNSVEKVKSLL